MKNKLFRHLMICLLFGGFSSATIHAEVSGQDLASEDAAQIPGLSLGSDAVAGEQLDGLRGGTETVINQQMLDGSVRDNQAYNLNTGSNLIGESSFAGSNGFSTVIQNSGNNVLIQNSTILNIQIK